MDHSLEDSLNLESAMGVDFEPSEDIVVSQSDVTLNTSHDDELQMEFQHIEEQPMLMDTSNDEIIDFMGEQFTLQEYSVQDDQITGPTTTVEENQNMMASQSDTVVDLQYDPQIISVPAAGVSQETFIQATPKYLPVKAAPNIRPAKKEIATAAPLPRQVAIAPKPPRLTQIQFQKLKSLPAKQFAIAPKPAGKPVAFTNKTVSLAKRVTGVVQGKAKTTTVLAQIGKQLVMMPSGGSQKVKLVTSASGVPTVRIIEQKSDQAQLIPNPKTSVLQPTKVPVMAKLVVQAQQKADGSNQPVTITKLMPVSNTGSNQTRFLTMDQKTVPVSLGNKVVMASPTEHGVRYERKQEIITIKSPTAKILPGPAPQGIAKKVVISGSPTQNIILKTTAPPKISVSDGSGPRTQFHQINVPGKGIQYIRLVTNSSSAVKSIRKVQPAPGKTFVLSDGKGNIIQMSGSQPPPLLVANNTVNKVTPKPPPKLVRIAPLTAKATQASIVKQIRSGQSLLAPLSPQPEAQSATLDDVNEVLESRTREEAVYEHEETVTEQPSEEIDSKAALHALIADAVGEDSRDCDTRSAPDTEHMHEVQIEMQCDRNRTLEQEDSSSEEQPERGQRNNEHPLIVIPSFKHQADESNDRDDHNESREMSALVNVEVDAYNPYTPDSPPTYYNDPDLVTTDILRPRKACNCTKSQCLKLYCDCFANGEFCNQCNCNNCHNNLENEELRQKAIRGCLDRNPNAFRPKIGKSKAGGPELIRRHNKGCNCKRSGCLKNYCECYEAKIACTAICKCVGCRNVEESVERARRRDTAAPHRARSPPPPLVDKQPCSFMTTEVIEAVCQCLLAAAAESDVPPAEPPADPVRLVLDEFTRCLQDIISASRHAPLALLDETQA